MDYSGMFIFYPIPSPIITNWNKNKSGSDEYYHTKMHYHDRIINQILILIFGFINISIKHIYFKKKYNYIMFRDTFLQRDIM